MEIDTLAVLGRIGAIDPEQLLAFQYAKLVRPGDRVIDVGAHTGLHASRLLRLVGPTGTLILVEPIGAIVERYLAPLFEGDPRCELFRGALAEREGTAEFFVVTGSEQESGLKLKDAYVQPTSLAPVRTEVALSTLDALAGGRRISFVKIDVEGAELRVLAGGRATLERSRPVVAIETGESIRTHGATPADLHALVRGLDYEIASVLGTPLPRDDFLAAVRSGAVWDFLLLPRERAPELREALASPDSPYLRDRCVDLRATCAAPHARGLVGFSSVESWGRWTDARLSPTAYVHLAAPVGDDLVIDVALMSLFEGGTRVVVGTGSEEEELLAGPRLAVRSVRFRRAGGREVLSFRPLRTLRGRGPDPRKLGVGIQSVRLGA